MPSKCVSNAHALHGIARYAGPDAGPLVVTAYGEEQEASEERTDLLSPAACGAPLAARRVRFGAGASASRRAPAPAHSRCAVDQREREARNRDRPVVGWSTALIASVSSGECWYFLLGMRVRVERRVGMMMFLARSF